MFSDIVVVDGNQIGCVVKTWDRRSSVGYTYDVYVRSYNSIREYNEQDMQRYVVSKELSEEEQEWHQRD
jgi:hypothetical protein